MRTRRTASCLLLAAALLAVAGCDRCLDCRCTCDHHTASGLETRVVIGKHGFDCGQTCALRENCGTGDVVASECLRASVAGGRGATERCARLDPPALRR